METRSVDVYLGSLQTLIPSQVANLSASLILTAGWVWSAEPTDVLPNLIPANPIPVDLELGAMWTQQAMPSVPVNLVWSQNLTPSQVVDQSVSLTLTVSRDTFVKLEDVLSNLTPVIPTLVDLELSAQWQELAMPSVDVNLDWSQTLTPSLDVNLSVWEIQIVRGDTFVRTKDVLRNLTPVTPPHVDLEQTVQWPGQVMPSADVNLVWYPTLIQSLDVNPSVSLTLTVVVATSAKIRNVLRNQILATHHPVDQELYVQLILEVGELVTQSKNHHQSIIFTWNCCQETLSADVSQDWSPNLTPSLAVDQSVHVTQTVTQDTCVSHRDVCHVLTHVNHLPVALTLSVWRTDKVDMNLC